VNARLWKTIRIVLVLSLVFGFLGYGTPAQAMSSTPDWSISSDINTIQFGKSVASAGDVNGDGYDEVIIGTHQYDGSYGSQGKAQLYYGSSTGLSTSIGWSALGGQNGAWLGWLVGSAGDVNGDGYDDVFVSAMKYSNGQTEEGKVWVYHGSSSGLSTTAAWSVEGDQANAWFGYSTASAGDVNGDGYDDLIVGAGKYDNGNTDEGKVWVYHGSSSGLSTTAAWSVEGDQDSAVMGRSASTAGDVNGDGYDDVIVGASLYDNGQTDEGKVWVYPGSSSGLSTTASWSFESDQASAVLGVSSTTAGDINGDGYDDVIVGASLYDNGHTDEGKVWVFHGSSTGLSTTAAWSVESNQYYGWLGLDNAATAGDINGDRYDDIIVGASKFDVSGTDGGRVWVYKGSSSGLESSAYLTLNGGCDYWPPECDNLGYGVGSAGDVDGNGVDEIIASAPYNNYPYGKVYVHYGDPPEAITGLDIVYTTPIGPGVAESFSATITTGQYVFYDWTFTPNVSTLTASGSNVSPTFNISYTVMVTATNAVSTQTVTETVTIESN